ncbi:MAG: hypothetical protein AAGC55_22400, partial [Myxococcota bacterium]
NPGDAPVDLGNYYLSDDADYAYLPGVFGFGPTPYINVAYSFDFIVKFPDGATIAPGQAIVVAMRGDGFTSVYGQAPDYALIEAGAVSAMVDPSTLPGASPGLTLAGTNPQLTNSGEGVVLFYWDGASDLVSDVDMVAVGATPSSINRLADKTGRDVEGPDSDDVASVYQPDAYTFTTMAGTATLGSSHKRIALEIGYEQRGVGGNGLFGDDETSEDFATTWDSPPLSAPTPGAVPSNIANGAYCGDGVLDSAAGEICDDGNSDDGDDCSNACRPASCDDGLHNADELDVDCGGHCGPGSCQDGQMCGADSDCSAGQCSSSTGTCVITSTVAAGERHTCVLSAAGSVRCWGRNLSGQSGQGNTETIGNDEFPSVLADIDLGGPAVQLAAGDEHNCAILDGGAVRCWGEGDWGRLGYGNTDDIGDDETPAAAGDVPLGGVAVKIAAGHGHTCAVLASGAVRCWGMNNYGQLGYGNTDTIGDDETPAAAGDVAIGGFAIDVAVGQWHTCVLLSGGGMRCWGYNNGRLGYGDGELRGDDETPDTLGLVPIGGTVVQMALGTSHSCALLDTGAVRCWGYDNWGQLGLGGFAPIV